MHQTGKLDDISRRHVANRDGAERISDIPSIRAQPPAIGSSKGATSTGGAAGLVDVPIYNEGLTSVINIMIGGKICEKIYIFSKKISHRDFVYR